MIENMNIRSGVYESLNNKSIGYLIVPFLLKISRLEIMIFYSILLTVLQEVWQLETWSSIFRDFVASVTFW